MNQLFDQLGRIAFEAYREHVGAVAHDGNPIPEWDQLDGDRAATHEAWQQAGYAVATAVAVEFRREIDTTHDRLTAVADRQEAALRSAVRPQDS
jgi:hypothetical protein